VHFAFGAPIAVAPSESVSTATDQLKSTLQALTDDLQAGYPVDGTGQWWQPRHLGGTAPTVDEAAASDAARDVRRRRESAGAAH
jgi:hypothetical protein